MVSAERHDRAEDDDLSDVDAASWWLDAEDAHRSYLGPPLSDDMVQSVESELGYRLPTSYVALMRRHNGGLPRLTCCPAPNRTTWATDHVRSTASSGSAEPPPTPCAAALAAGSGSRSGATPTLASTSPTAPLPNTT